MFGKCLYVVCVAVLLLGWGGATTTSTYKSSLEIGEKFLRVTGSFARKLNASSAKVEWQKKQHLSDKATIEKLRSELAQLQHSLKPPASGKFS